MKITKYIARILSSAALMVTMLSSCLSGNDTEYVVTDYYNAVVTSFSLVNNTNVADNLSKYSFTIDNFGNSDARIHAMYPNDGIIFNPDSLPYGTIPDSVKVTIGFSSPDSVYFQLYSLNGALGQFADYNKDSALYFASYPDCRLNIVSKTDLSGYREKRTYHIKINVHRVDGDSIKWRNYTDELWSGMDLTAQRADTIGDIIYWLVESNGQNYVSTSLLSQNARQWTDREPLNIEGGDLLDLSTLYSWHQELLAVGKTSGALMASADGRNWTAINKELTFQSILGNQMMTQDVYKHWNSDTLNVIVKANGEYRFAVSANARDWRLDKVIPAGFPIAGGSRPISVPARSIRGNLTSRLYIVGGMDAEGKLTNSTWSCDGFNEDLGQLNWAEFPQNELPSLTSATVIEYTLDSDKPGTFWLLQPGTRADGTIPTNSMYGKQLTTLYYSEDSGVSWHRLNRYYARLADNSVLGPVAANSGIVNPKNYEICFFGGRKDDGSFKTSVWGGALPKLNYKKVR